MRFGQEVRDCSLEQFGSLSNSSVVDLVDVVIDHLDGGPRQDIVELVEHDIVPDLVELGTISSALAPLPGSLVD